VHFCAFHTVWGASAFGCVKALHVLMCGELNELHGVNESLYRILL
jgi:hypothetical protein